MAKANTGRLMGCKFKTFSGAANRAASERMFDTSRRFRFAVEEADASDRLRGWVFRIRKTKCSAEQTSWLLARDAEREAERQRRAAALPRWVR